MYQVLIKKNLRGAFPNVEVLLRIYLSLMVIIIVTVAERNGSFSKLKLIKDEHRSTISQNRLVHPTIHHASD